MPKFVIERSIPGIGASKASELKSVSQHSCSVLEAMGGAVQWLESYVTDQKMYCIYLAPSEDLVREHARRGGFPADSIAEVRITIDPVTAEA